MQQLLGALSSNQRETDRFFGVLAGTVPIPEYFAPEHVMSIIQAQADAPVQESVS
jgi:hypothetical protein